MFDAIAPFMWGNNVLRSRRGLCAVYHIPRSRWYSAAAEPVSDQEFLDAFERVYPRRKWHSHKSVGQSSENNVALRFLTLEKELR